MRTRASSKTACIEHLTARPVIQADIPAIMQVRHRVTATPVMLVITTEHRIITISVIPRTAQPAIRATAGQVLALRTRAFS